MDQIGACVATHLVIGLGYLLLNIKQEELAMKNETDELYQFLACDYYATGEGRTVCLLITRAYPHTDDYETPSKFEDGVYTPPVMKSGHTPKVRAAREFAENFGGWYLQGAENLPREEFMKRFGHYLPDYVKNVLTSDDKPGNMNYTQQFHINFS